jgi:nicotinamidase-related amidase
MIIDAPRSVLLVIDMQDKILPSIGGHEQVTAACAWLVRAAQRVGVPVAATEHCAKTHGHTTAPIKALLPPDAVAAKSHFSAVAAQCLSAMPGADRPQAVLVGVEAHVAVLQTALELMEEGKEVYVVADAVSSRHDRDRDLALSRLRQEGVRIVSREMVLCEWLGDAGSPLWKEISRDFLR